MTQELKSKKEFKEWKKNIGKKFIKEPKQTAQKLIEEAKVEGIQGGKYEEMLRKGKSLRDIEASTGVSRYKIKKQIGEPVVEEVLMKREVQAQKRRVAKTVGGVVASGAKSLIKSFVKVARPYVKTQRWASVRQRPSGSYKNPYEFAGTSSGEVVEPTFHVGTHDNQPQGQIKPILDLKQEQVTPLLFKSPIQDQTDRPMSTSNLLDMSDNQNQGQLLGETQNRLLDLSNRDSGTNSLLDMSNSNTNRLLDLRRRKI